MNHNIHIHHQHHHYDQNQRKNNDGYHQTSGVGGQSLLTDQSQPVPGELGLGWIELGPLADEDVHDGCTDGSNKHRMKEIEFCPISFLIFGSAPASSRTSAALKSPLFTAK